MNINLVIVGDGPQKDFLNNLIINYGIEKICTIEEFTSNIETFTKIRYLHFLLLYESFGNTIS